MMTESSPLLSKEDAKEGEDFLHEIREKFERATERENSNRVRAMDDIKFARLGEQWPEKVKRQRERDGRPCLVKNRLQALVRYVVNEARQNRPAITVVPADSKADPQTAEMMSGLIRNIEVSSDADIAYDTAVEAAVSGGFGYFRVNIAYADEDTFDKDIVIERIADPFAVFGDPDSESADGSDWNCAFVVSTMTKDAFEAKYKGKDAVDWDAEGYTGLPAPWLDGDNVMIAEYWHREDVAGQLIALSDGTVVNAEDIKPRLAELAQAGIGPVGEPRTVTRKQVTQYIVSGAEVLETVEWPGKYIPIIPVYGEEVWCEGERHLKSLIHDAKDAQREENYWTSAATEAVALAPKVPFIGPKGAFNTDYDKWSTANETSHAFIEYDGPQPPQRQPYAGPPMAEMQLAMTAVENIKAITGIYDASLGAKSNETSGIAIRQRQRQGDVATFHFIDNLSRAIRQAGRVIVDLIPKVFNTARVARILGEDMTPETVQLAPQADQQRLMMEAQQRGQQLLRLYDVSLGKYDLVVKSGPAFGTQREAARAEIVEIIRAVPDSARVLGPMYLRNSDWPGADKAADELEGGAQGGQNQQAQAMAQQMQQKIAELETQNRELQNQYALKQQELAIKNKEADIKAQEVSLKGQMALIEAQRPIAAPPPNNPYGLG